MGVDEFVKALNRVIINPLIALIFAAGLLVFMWGMVQFMAGLNGEGEGAQDGKRHMLWGIIGMFIMVAAFAFIKIISSTLNVPVQGL